MALTLDEVEDSVHGWGIEYDDGTQVVCLQTLRADKSVINQILVPVAILNSPGRIKFAVPIDYREYENEVRRTARALLPKREDQERYVAAKLTQMVGAIILDGKEFPMTLASLKSAELLLGMFADGAPQSQSHHQERQPGRPAD